MKAICFAFSLICIIICFAAAPAVGQPDSPSTQSIKDADGDGLIDSEDRCPNQIGPADRGGCPEEGTEMLTRPIVTQVIPFSAGGTIVSSEADKQLKKLASAIRKGGGRVLVVIEGHADASGIKEDNDKLSVARAQVVSDALVRRGVPVTRITVKGRGSSVPIADNSTQEGRMKNRRAEVRVYTSIRQ
jgi:OOP family OmpA-OmpF porin